MKKIFLYASLFITAVSFTACNEDFTDWANPQAWEQEAAQDKIGNGAIEILAQDIDLDAAESIGIAKANCPSGSNEGSVVKFTKVRVNGDTEIPFTSENGILTIQSNDLQEAIANAYTSLESKKREIAFTIDAVVVNADGVATPITINDNTIKLNVKSKTVALPSIANEEAFYYIGGYNSWNLKEPTPMIANGDGTYSCIIELKAGDEWFAFAPQSAVDSENWDLLFRAPKNGETATKGFFTQKMPSGDSFCFSVEAAGKFKFTIDPKGWAYSYEKVVEQLFIAGDANGWSFSPLAKSGDNFVGYYYVKYADNSNTWGFKFTQDASWDLPQYGAGDATGTMALGGGNLQLAEKDAFYQITVNTGNLTCTLSEISQMSLIGSAVNGDSSWGTDYDLTFNTETMAWEGTYEMTDGEYKIRANHDWALSWGGSLDAMTSSNGANLSITAGTYTFSFKPNCDGQGVLTVTAK